VAWGRRPRAAALLGQAQEVDRGFDAVVVGEFERAITDRQFGDVVTVLDGCGVSVWLPEVGGPVDLADPHHRMLVQVFAVQSQREVVRSRHRTLAAMTAQTVKQGRFLGGRPPYGYRLVDAGPHPNRAQAAWGRRAQRLDPDPMTARHVRWTFAKRLAGRSVAGRAEVERAGCAVPVSRGSRPESSPQWEGMEPPVCRGGPG
jgi:hypothetical protein